MSEEHDPAGAFPEDAGAADENQGRTQVRTGVPAVDAVIEAVESLEDRPLEEHLGVFESAHGELRRALDAPAGRDRPA